MNRAYAFISEAVTTLVDLVFPRSISRRLLPQPDHFAPHKGTGFEGWYTRIQGEDFSMAIIMCSLAPEREARSHRMTRQHYLHFSLVPLRETCVVKKKIELHLFPERIVPVSTAPGQLPFTLDAPGFGVFICQPKVQTYELRLLDEEVGCFYTINVLMTERMPLDLDNDLNCVPHGSFARLQSILPLHWAIFSTSSKANISIRRTWVGSGAERGSEIVLDAVGRAHMEKNWGVSFPHGWTWSQASSAPSAGLSNLSLVLAGGMILGNKAMMVHYRSPSHNWIFAPPYTIIPSIPNFISPFHRLRRRLSGTTGKHGREYRSIQWGPFTSESYSNVNGVLSVSVQDFTRKLGITVRATEPPSTGTWLSLYCPLPGGHSTTAYETFTATMDISAFTRRWPFGSWKLVETHRVPDAALEFGGAYWNDSTKHPLD